MNFGLCGPFLAISLWSFFANRMVRRAMLETSVLRCVMYVFIAVSLSSSLLYSEFLGWVARLGVMIFPLWIASYFESPHRLRHSLR
jgi:hypothetical protein